VGSVENLQSAVKQQPVLWLSAAMDSGDKKLSSPVKAVMKIYIIVS